MGSTFQTLIDNLVAYRHLDYRSDPERAQARLDAIEYALQTALEKLRDKFDPS